MMVFWISLITSIPALLVATFIPAFLLPHMDVWASRFSFALVYIAVKLPGAYVVKREIVSNPCA